MLDLRPLQAPDRAPLTAGYLRSLLDALHDDPQPGESFSFLLASDLEDPTAPWPRLSVIGRRLLPPTRFLRAAALTVDPILLRGASAGAGWRAERTGAAGAVYHAASGALPLGSSIPVVAVLLDLAPWELPAAYRRGRLASLGQRLRGRLIRDAAAVIAPSRAAALAAHATLGVRESRVRVVPLAARPAFVAPSPSGAAEPMPPEARRLGLAPGYAVYPGRHDARHDLATLLEALAGLAPVARVGAPSGVEMTGDAAPIAPARLCVVGASPDDREAIARAAARAGVSDRLAYAPALPEPRLAALVAAARFVVLPMRSDTTGLLALDALAARVPIVASAVGALPEVVGRAGILVEPGDAARLAAALDAAWSDDALHARLVAASVAREAGRRTWADVARETRAVWADVARRAPLL